MKIINYDLDFIIRLIQSQEKLKEERFYKSDVTASVLLLDLELLLDQAGLTDKQFFVIEKYWVEGYTQEQVASKLGVTQQMVEKQTKAIKRKIQRVLEKWGEVAVSC